MTYYRPTDQCSWLLNSTSLDFVPEWSFRIDRSAVGPGTTLTISDAQKIDNPDYPDYAPSVYLGHTAVVSNNLHITARAVVVRFEASATAPIAGGPVVQFQLSSASSAGWTKATTIKVAVGAFIILLVGYGLCAFLAYRMYGRAVARNNEADRAAARCAPA